MSKWKVKSPSKPGGRDRVELEELYSRIRTGILNGFSDLEIAREAGCSDRTVLRYRQRRKIANFYKRE